MAKRKQQHIPGMEPPVISDIETAAELYVDARDKRMKLLKQEIEKGDELLELMRKHKLTEYQFDGRVVSVQELQKVRVRKAKVESNGDDDDGDEE